MSLFEIKKEKLIFHEKNLYREIKNIIINKEHNYKLMLNTLKLVNPLGILDKGYSLVTKDAKTIKESNKLKPNDIIDIKFRKGNIKSKVIEVFDEGENK